MSGGSEPVWVRQVAPVRQAAPIGQPAQKQSGQPQQVSSSPMPSNGTKGSPVRNGSSPQSIRQSSQPRVSDSPLSSPQIRSGPHQPLEKPLERPSSGSSLSSMSSTHSQISLSRSNSGSSTPGTPTKKHHVHQNLPNVSVISTNTPSGPASLYQPVTHQPPTGPPSSYQQGMYQAPTGPVSSYPQGMNQAPTGPAPAYPQGIHPTRPDMIPGPSYTSPQIATPTTTQDLPSTSQTPKVQSQMNGIHKDASSSNKGMVAHPASSAATTAHSVSTVPTIAHPAFRTSVEDHAYFNQPEIVACNGQETTGSSSLPDLLSNGSYMLDLSVSDESSDLVSGDIRTDPKRRPFRHSYSDGVPNALTRRRSFTMAEAKTHAFSRLQHELTNAQVELKLKDEECEKLSKVRIQMEQELEDLTASLFEEANKMVQDANIKRMKSEKLLAESNQQIEVLQAEVIALKQLVLTSTPNTPNKHLHPQIATPKKEKSNSIKPFWKTHRRSTSHHEFTKEARQKEEEQQEQSKIKCKEIDTACLDEFQKWRQKPEFDHGSPFFNRVFHEDIKPCLNFQNQKLATRLQQCVEHNCLTIEPIPGDNSYPRKCSLTESNKLCNYKIRLNDEQDLYSISQLCRNRIAAVCDFYTYIRYIQQGLVKSEDKEAFYEISRLRRQMALAKLGYT